MLLFKKMWFSIAMLVHQRVTVGVIIVLNSPYTQSFTHQVIEASTWPKPFED